MIFKYDELNLLVDLENVYNTNITLKLREIIVSVLFFVILL